MLSVREVIDSRHRKVARLSVLCTCPLYLQSLFCSWMRLNLSWYF